MGYESNSGLGVSNQYGQRSTGNSVGIDSTDNSIGILSIQFTGQSLNEAFMPPLVFPRGAHPIRYILRVDEAFALTGTTPGVSFGGLAPVTNGVALTQAELQAIGTKIPASTGAGTWSVTSATGTTANEKVSKSLTGTTPVVTAGVGKATLTVEYSFTAKV